MKNSIIILLCILALGCKTTEPKPDAPITIPAVEVPSIVSGDGLKTVQEIAMGSQCAKYGWGNRGKMKPGYLKGMALTYAKAVCEPMRSDVVLASRARKLPESKYDATDALSWYNSNFAELGMKNDISGVSTLRHVYALLLGLGMRESSGRWCAGIDTSDDNTGSSTAEAGLFQTSYNTIDIAPEAQELFEKYRNSSKGCMLDTFKEGVSCTSGGLKNWGSGRGKEFQQLSKECPAFAAEYASMVMRLRRKHYGPITRKEAEIRSECDWMFRQIDTFIQANSEVCKEF